MRTSRNFEPKQKDERTRMTDNAGSRDAVVIERSFDAPVDLIWKMWTDPEHFKAWYGPDGATIPVARIGRAASVAPVWSVWEMQTPNGAMQMWFTGEYREVIENERLVYTESMSDEHGNVTSPASMGMPEGHPAVTEVRVDLVDVGGRTKMVMTHAEFRSDSPGAAGWSMAFDKLVAPPSSTRPVDP